MFNYEVRDMYNTIAEMVNMQVTPEFAYALSQNKRMLKPYVDVLSVAHKERYTEGYNAYEEARIAMCKELAKKDENGKPLVSPDGVSFIMADRTLFEARFESLRLQHKAALDEHTAKIKKYDAFLEEEVDVPPALHRMDLSSFPEKMAVRHMDALLAMVRTGAEAKQDVPA